MSAHPSVLLVVKGLDIGGIERVVADLALGLAAREVPVEVAVVNDRRDGLADSLRGTAVVVHGLGGTDRVGLRAARRLASLVAAPRFDVVHVHGPLPAVVARLTRGHRPVVTTSHTVWPALRPATRLAWRLTAHRDAALVAVSGGVAASLPQRLAARTRVIPHGVDRTRVEAALRTAQSMPRSGDDGVTAVAVASHRDAKNYPNLLRALRIARDLGAPLHLIAVGEGPDLERHRGLAHEVELGDHVSFVPPTPDVLATIAAADLLVVASDFEGQPLVVAEALALGRPVVATAVGRVPELVSPTTGRVVAPGDAAALGAALAELASDANLREQMGSAARLTGSAWTLDHVIEAHLALYAHIQRG